MLLARWDGEVGADRIGQLSRGVDVDDVADQLGRYLRIELEELAEHTLNAAPQGLGLIRVIGLVFEVLDLRDLGEEADGLDELATTEVPPGAVVIDLRTRREYEGWPALRKLEYVDRVLSEEAGRVLPPVDGPRVEPIETLQRTVARHYQRLGYRMEEYGFADEAVAYFDEDLQEVFREPRSRASQSAASVLRGMRRRIVDRVVDVLGVRPSTAESVYDKYVQRSRELGIRAPRGDEASLLVAVSAMLAGHLLTAQHTGRFTPQRRVLRRR